jgi:hypothetical protein
MLNLYHVCIRVDHKAGPCTATFNDLLCLENLYHSTQFHIAEDNTLHSHHSKNVTSHVLEISFVWNYINLQSRTPFVIWGGEHELCLVGCKRVHSPII